MRPTAASKADRDGVSLELLRGTGRRPHGSRGLDRRRRAGSLLANPGLDLRRKGRVLAQVVADVISTLAETLVAVRHPRPALVEDPVFNRRVDQRSLARDAFIEEDAELGGPKRRRDLVLDDLDLHPVPDRIEPVLDDFDLADVQAYRGVELQGPTPGLCLGVAEHDPDLLPQLVEEDHGAVRLRDRGGELAQRLRHQARLEAHVRVTHLTLDLA